MFSILSVKHLTASYLLTLALLSNVQAATSQSQHTNALFENDSPYLAMHGHDPVNWQVWGAKTLAKAKKENKIIMISSGYFSCYWCHEMQKQNYQNAKTAAYLNKYFISVKIDRELTPDLDKFLIEFARKSAGSAGWPQHVFLTPDGYPFYAFTFKPYPDFLLALEKIETFWQTSPEKIKAAAQQAVVLATPAINKSFTLKRSMFNQQILQQLIPQMDTLSGGLKGSNKFPNAPILNTLLGFKTLDEDTTDWLKLTLDQMQSLHLFDHVYGGFYRYTIDPGWEIPHFEKMLYSQAQLADIYLKAGKRFNRPDYLATAKKTLQYVEKQLFQPNTGLYQSSQSAVDKHLIEGGDYLWRKSELKKLLTPKEFKQVSQDWHLDQPSPYEIAVKGKNHQGWLPSPTTQYWNSIQHKLAHNQIKPEASIPTDTKSILGWNGLLLSAFAQGVALKQVKPEKAEQLANNLIKRLQTNFPARAISARNTKMGSANIQDYAFVIRGLKDWQKVRPSSQLQQTILELLKVSKKKFLTPEGWLYSNTPLLPGQQGVWAMPDEAIPSPTAILECQINNTLNQAEAIIELSPLAYASYSHTLNKKLCGKKEY